MANGSGTQQDPYIFNSFLELLELMLDSQETDYYEYGGSVTEEDMNDYSSEGLNDPIILTGNVDFKDLTITNLRSFSNTVINLTGAIKNVTFKNAVWNTSSGTNRFIYGNFSDKIYNVRIYCEMQLNSCSDFNMIHNIRNAENDIDKCVIRIKGAVNKTNTTDSAIIVSKGILKDCNFIFDDFSHSIGALGIKSPTSTVAAGIKMIGCYVGGKIEVGVLKDTTNNSTTLNTNMLNVFNVECEGTFTHNSNGFNIFNSTKAPNFATDTTTNFIGVTDEQMKDPLYLQSIGFPCYGGE